MDEMDDLIKGSKPPGVNGGSGGDTSSSGAANDLLGLFAPPPPSPPRRALNPSLFTPPSETDPLIASPSSSSIAPPAETSVGKEPAETNVEDQRGIAKGGDETDDVSSTLRRTNSKKMMHDYESLRDKASPDKDDFPEHIVGSGRELFLKTAASSPQKNLLQPGQTAEMNKPDASWTVAASSRNLFGKMRSLLSPFASPTTWTGGILFVFYHVVFCMANGGSITRPSSGGNVILGDMARYTALGIVVSCPFLVFALSDRVTQKQHRIGIPALYPSLDTFLAPFLAEAAAVIDKIIMEDWNAGVIVHTDKTGGISPLDDENEEIFLTRMWFGSFALVVSFGMIAAGSLLILAPKIKLANLGAYLPYGVMCGFFSSVGVLMWKLAITIDTPITSKEYESHGHWVVLLWHHLPGLTMGIAMNRLGPKHPFFVTGLIILTVATFYAVMLVLGISLKEARSNGWFYTHVELQSSSSFFSSIQIDDANASISWRNRMLPPYPFGLWFAVFDRYVHWRAVRKGAEQMIALAILYLLRASIHAAAIKKSIPNMVRRVPIPKNEDIEIGAFDGGLPLSPPRHRRNHSTASVSTSISQLAQTVRHEVRIVNLSLADRQSLGGTCYTSPCPPSHPPRRSSSIGSTPTAGVRNIVGENNTNKRQRAISVGSNATAVARNVVHENSMELTADSLPDFAPPIPPRRPLKPIYMNEMNKENDDHSVLLPTMQREISSLTQRTVASPTPSETLSIAKKQSFKESRIGKDKKTKYSVDYVETQPPPTDLTPEEIFAQYAYGFFVTGVCGGFGCCPTAATSNIMYAIGAGDPAPQYLSVALLLFVFYSSGFELVRFIPKVAFSSLLVLCAADNIVTWFIKPISKMNSLLEWSVVPFIAMFSLLVGFLNAVILGIGVSTFLFVADFFRVGVVKYDASGLEIRSRIERSLVQSVWLDTHGDKLRVLVLQNYLFFGNATSVLRYIETMFEEIPLVKSIHLAYPIPPVPVVLVLDLSLITGMDTSAVDLFMDIWRVCKTNDCKLYICGLSPRLKKTFARGGMKPVTKGPRKFRTLLYFSDLDHGLGRAEDVLIDKDMGDFANQSLFQLEKGSSGFHVALQHIDQLHSANMADGLLELESHTKIVTLEEGQILYEKDGGLIGKNDHGLFFIESGMIRIDDGRSNRTNTRTGGSLRQRAIFTEGNDNSLRGKHARLDTAAQRAALTKLAGKEATHQSNNLRIATAGPGWVVGANEFAMGEHSLKKFRAITKVKMHHLRFSDLTKIENENPALVLRLYKMLTHVMARKEEDTVAHLSTLHEILSSPAHSKPLPRLSIGPISQK